jgi:hypothetical protein
VNAVRTGNVLTRHEQPRFGDLFGGYGRKRAIEAEKDDARHSEKESNQAGDSMRA